MATTKKTETKAETKAAEAKTTKAAETKTTKAAAKKTAEKKAPAKKTAAAKKAPAKKTAATKKAAATKVDFFVEFGGVQVSIDEVIKNVKLTYGKSANEIAVYLKPEESKAYYVADGNEGEMDVFFC